jgi:hypothetical protein
MKQKFDGYLSKPGVAGVMVWSWVPNQRSGCSLESFPADPLMSLIESYR